MARCDDLIHLGGFAIAAIGDRIDSLSRATFAWDDADLELPQANNSEIYLTRTPKRSIRRTTARKVFSSIQVTSDEYFARLIHYIHFNPQKHDFVSDFREYPYSSYQILYSDKATRLRRDEVLAWCGGKESFKATHQAIVEEKAIAKFIEDDYD